MSSKATVPSRLVQRTAARISQALLRQRVALEEFNTLRAVRDVVATHGLSQPVVALINHDEQLSQIVETLPAVESLNVVPLPLSDPRNKTSLEELDTALGLAPMAVSEWIKGLADDLGKLLDASHGTVDVLQRDVDEAQEDIRDTTISDEALGTTIVTARSADGFAAIFAALTSRLTKVSSIDVEAFCTSTEYRDANRRFISEMVDEFRSILGYSLEDGHFVHEGSDAIDAAYQPCEGSLSDLGYDIASVEELLSAIDGVLEAIDGVAAQKDTMQDALRQVAERLSERKDGDVSLEEAHDLISNYAEVILALVEDAFHHTHEALSVIDEVIEVVDDAPPVDPDPSAT